MAVSLCFAAVDRGVISFFSSRDVLRAGDMHGNALPFTSTVSGQFGHVPSVGQVIFK